MEPSADDRWPNLFIVGVGKAGTSSLAEYVSHHPDIFISPLKEPHFFSDATPRLAPTVKAEEDYLRLFSDAQEPVRGEASVSYFWDPGSASRIRRVRPDARIVVILRDPVERAHSHYWHAYKNGVERRPFALAAQQELAGSRPAGLEPYLARSLYSEPLARYLEAFPGNVHVVFFEELVHDPASELVKLFSFLQVPPGPAEHADASAHNAFALPRNPLAGALFRSANVRRAARSLVPSALRPRLEALLLAPGSKPALDETTLGVLERFFESDRGRLEALLGRRVTW